MKKNQYAAVHVKYLVLTAMLGALAFGLMLLYPPIPIFPSFLKFDLAEIPSLFAGFFLGPLGGMGVILVKMGLKLVFDPSKTGYIGELMSVIGSVAYVLPASLIYRFRHTRGGAGIALVAGTLIASVVMVFVNKYMAFPLYGNLYHMSIEDIVEMGTKVMPFIKDETMLLWLSVFPFNLLKHGVTALLVWIMYKRVSILVRSVLEQNPRPDREDTPKGVPNGDEQHTQDQ
ncbi:MAG: ECF transporter S component [Lachnospiraceae bacterium]|nr:ECF transporter S component [Lachnospiraceae bacterium]